MSSETITGTPKPNSLIWELPNMKRPKRIRISLKSYETIIRNNIGGDYLWKRREPGKKAGTFAMVYARGEEDDAAPVAMWESTGYGWVWQDWKYPSVFKRMLTGVRNGKI